VADEDDNQSTNGHDAYDVGCYGLVAGVATRTRTGERVQAAEVARDLAPFHCADCLTDAVVRKCTERIDHFAHKARLSPVVSRGESDLHKNCKEEIRDRLIELFPNGNWACERPISANKAKNIPLLVPDVSGRIGDSPVVIEIQASYLTVPRIIRRAAGYRARKCAIVWIVPLTEKLGDRNFRPRLYERYLHSIYYGRTYYWLPGDGLLLRPVHYGVAYRHIDESEWYNSGGELQQAIGYEKAYKIVKKPVYGDRIHLVDDFRWHNRGELIPWNENKAVPPLLTWQDTLDVWWDETEQNDFERRYTNDG
jgi:hypothetical protein